MAVNPSSGRKRPLSATGSGSGSPSDRQGKREPLTRDRVLDAAVTLADEAGVQALSMRKLGQALGVEAMSLYNHVPNKEAILDGIVERVVSEIDLPESGDDWRGAMRERAIQTYRALLRHPWAASLIESRTNPIPARTRSCENVIGVLRGAGFSIRHAYHAFLTLDSYIYGFALQEVSWPTDKAELPEAIVTYQKLIPADRFPNIAAMMSFIADDRAHSPLAQTEDGYAPEFEFGLDLILDGLERLRDEQD